MPKLAWLAVISLTSLALAGCAGGSEETSKAPVSNQTYEVKVLGSHALQNKDRTFKVDLVQGGVTVGTTTFTIKKGTPETPVVALTKTLPAGPVTANVFEGSNPVGTKTLDPARCPKPLEFEMHAIDDALHTYSNCD